MFFQYAIPLSAWAVLLPMAAELGFADSDFGSREEDTRVLEAAESRSDMACELFPAKAVLGWDIKFHAGYELALPLRELYGSGNTLSALYRVAAKGTREAVYFRQRAVVPPIKERSGDISLFGSFDIGEGSYHVDWMMRDGRGRFCSAHWNVDAALPPNDRNVAVALPPGSICRSTDEQFQSEPEAQHKTKGPQLRVKVLVNAAPSRPHAAALDPKDRIVLASILRSLARDPRVGRISLVAFNIEQRKVLYRQNSYDQIDFPAVGAALASLKLGFVDVKQLQNRNGDIEFLSDLVKNEFVSNIPPDGLIFAGPKSLMDSCISKADLKEIGKLGYPVFNLTYSTEADAMLWPDAIGRVVRFFKGQEYEITVPHELWNAVNDAVGRIEKSKQELATHSPAAQTR